jgi:hypothetical protein
MGLCSRRLLAQVVRIGWYKDNRVYIRTAMPFGTRLNLKPFEVFEVHFPTVGPACSLYIRSPTSALLGMAPSRGAGRLVILRGEAKTCQSG